MRRLVRALAVGLTGAAGCMLLLPGGTANADATKVGVVQQAWFWQNAYEQANPPVAQTPPATEPSGVPDGDLAVAYTGNSDKSSSKTTALSFDVSNVTPGSSVSTFTFSLTLDASPTATSYDTVGAAIVACLPTRAWPAVLAGDYTNQPTVDCAHKVAPEVSGSTYTFKIPAIAQTWVDDQNLGVAILADPDAASAPFQLVFAGAKDVKADLAFTPTATGTTSGSTTGAGAVAVPPSSGGSAPVAPPVVPPVTGGTTTVAAAAPVVAASPVAQPQRVSPAAAKTAPAIPTKAFWAAALVLGLIVLAASLVLGDPAPVAASTATSSRLDRVLRGRTGSLATRSL